MSRSVVSGSAYTVDVADFGRLATALRRVDATAYRRMTSALRVVARSVASAAAGQASTWSTRIPRTVRTQISGLNAYVVAGGPDAPHAAAFENKGQAGEFRHPVWGHFDRWVSQQARPYLTPTLERKKDEVVDGFMGAIDGAIRDAGLV